MGVEVMNEVNQVMNIALASQHRHKEIDEEMEKYGRIGAEKAKELSNRVLLLVEHAPDYQQMSFAQAAPASASARTSFCRYYPF